MEKSSISMSTNDLFSEEIKQFKLLDKKIKSIKSKDERLHVAISKSEFRVRTREEIEADKERVKREIKAGKALKDIKSGKTELEHILSSTSIQKFSGPRLCTFTNKLIEELPFCVENVQLTDTTFTAKDGGGRLILRVGATSKTFYPVAAFGSRPTGRMLGKYVNKASNYYIDQGKNKEANVKVARERFVEYIDDVSQGYQESQKGGNMTIRYYLESGRYMADREKYPVKSGKVKSVTQNTIDQILSAFEPFLGFRLNEVNKNWVIEFDEYTSQKRTNKANKITIDGLSSDSKRKLYSAFNAMFNICVRANYIKVNKIDGFASKFPRSKPNPKTYKIGYDELLEFIFDDDTPGSLSGKLIVAGMAVTGARNQELFANYIDNFDFKERSIFIPAHISKNREAGERTVYPVSDLYWKKLELHLIGIPRNPKGHMFPSPIHPETHISAEMYKKTWKAVKMKFNLKNSDRLYNLRHTLLTKIAKSHGVDVAAAVAGDSIETANKYYNEKDEERLRSAFEMNTGSQKINETANGSSNDIITGAIVAASKVSMPKTIVSLFEMFINGKVIPKPEHLYKADWDKFVSLVKMQKESGLIEGSDLDMWLMMQ